jgi:hypothetical protein
MYIVIKECLLEGFAVPDGELQAGSSFDVEITSSMRVLCIILNVNNLSRLSPLIVLDTIFWDGCY